MDDMNFYFFNIMNLSLKTRTPLRLLFKYVFELIMGLSVLMINTGPYHRDFQITMLSKFIYQTSFGVNKKIIALGSGISKQQANFHGY